MVQFGGACVNVMGQDDEVCVVGILNELVVGVERLEVGGSDGIRRWSQSGALYYWLISTSWTTHHHYTQYGVCAHQRTTPASCTRVQLKINEYCIVLYCSGRSSSAILVSSMEWQTVSNAFQKSEVMTTTNGLCWETL